MPAQKDPIEIDPIALQEDLRDRMERYLLTSLPIHRRFPNLRAQASEELGKSASLVRGPYLEALPDYPKKETLNDMVEAGVLHAGFKSVGDDVLNRPLHKHQTDAIKRIVSGKENVVVATGTGSGKTECFLYPMVDSLLKAKVAGKPGIRAILVYPLNALANDQLYRRIVPLLVDELRDYGITVGRYTGQTKPGKNRRYFEELYLQDPFFSDMFGKKIPDNWLLSREEMLANQPHVLVTNYAMLEHLLLLPQNSSLFRNADLQFLVLDEVHTYAGAQATEVSLLLRKLRNRYAPKADVRCIGTSASLGSSLEAQEKVKEFAGRLFGFPFKQVVTAKREAHHLLQSQKREKTLSAQEWIKLHEILRSVRHLADEGKRRDQWNEQAMDADIDLLIEKRELSLSTLLCQSLATDTSVREVSRILSEEGLQNLARLAVRIFPGADNSEQGLSALTGLVALGAYAREGQNTFPLLPARYHIFTRGIEEATIELVHPSQEVEQGHLLKFRREFRNPETDKPRYRLMTCRKCGELYFEGYEKGQRIVPESNGKGWSRSVFWLKAKDSHVLPTDSTEQQAEARSIPDPVFINLQTGVLKDLLDESDNEVEWLETHRARIEMPSADELDANADAPARVKVCQSCGAQERREIITPFHPGDQALSASICEVLYAHLPTNKNPDERHRQSGRGRNLLVFSDNRQDAAFFAPNFQRSHEDLLVRRAVVAALRQDGPVRLQGLAEDLCNAKFLLKGGLTDQDGKTAVPIELAKIIRGKLFSEFCSPGGSRVSLEDLGLVLIDYHSVDLEELSARAEVPSALGADVVRWVLDTIRLNRAISMPSELSAADEFVWGAYAQDNRRYTLELEDNDGRFRMLPSHRDNGSVFVNRYVDVLRDKLGRQDWEAILRRIWNVLIDDEEGAILLADPEGSPLRVLDSRYIQARIRKDTEALYRCDRCSRISSYSVGGVCTQWRCKGHTELVPAEEWSNETKRNHYHYIYSELEDLPSVIAREHTAAISTELREEIETAFKAGKINLLSSSTTMEMGIDLGDLEGVFLRNVPPDISNYQQRAGRAGRRAQAAPVSITYSRNRRYDQDVYEHADEFLAKEPRSPFVHLGNVRLFQRHQFSILVAHYMAHLGLNERGIQIGQFLGLPRFKQPNGRLAPEAGGPTSFSDVAQEQCIRRLSDWLTGTESVAARRLADELLHSLSPSLTDVERSALETANKTLEGAFLFAMRRLAETFGDRFRHYMNRAEELNREGRPGVDTMRDRAYRWANQPVVNFLAKYGVIPTYSFPVDSIDLEVTQGVGSRNNRPDIELSRDARLGIVEYAPGAEVIANGRVWTSRAISQHPTEFMPPFYYKICETCRHIEAWEDRSLIPSECSCCNSELSGVSRVMIEPRGFVTAAGEADGREPGSSRVRPPSAMETQLIGNAPDSHYRGTELVRVEWALQSAQEGRMVVINKGRGEGFVKCGCGYAHAVTPNKRITEPHRNPYTNHECTRAPSGWRFDLAHTFHTDVLQIRSRVIVPIPTLPSEYPDPSEQRNALEGVARAIVEAIRLACCELMDIPEMEISGTFRWLQNDALEIILFDNVPGGAGYTAKAFELKISDIFRCAKDSILNCPDGCSTSCSKCLRSYSNQFYWESFRRIEAISWFEEALRLQGSDSRLALGAVEIRPDLVRDLCDKASQIIVFRDRLGDFTGGVESDDRGKEVSVVEAYPEWKRINEWLVAGKKVTLVCHQLPRFEDHSLPRARRFAEVLLPWVRSGELTMARVSASGNEWSSDHPAMVICDDRKGRSALVYDLKVVGGLLHQLWSDSLLSRDVAGLEVETYLPSKGILVAADLERPDAIQRWHYRSGEARTLERDFAYLSEAKIHKLEIVDRYLVGAESNRNSLKEFMGMLAGIWDETPKKVLFRYGPCPQQSQRLDWINAMEQIKKDLHMNPKFAGAEFESELRGNSRMRNFHDRRLVVQFDGDVATPASNVADAVPRKRRRGKQASATVNRRTKIAELTGGIDVLMDNREETTIYVFESSSG